MLKNVACGGPPAGSGDGGGAGGVGAFVFDPRFPAIVNVPPTPRPPPARPRNSQIPERSGLPSGVRGVGASRFGLPSAVLGTSEVGKDGHCIAPVSETMGEMNIRTAIGASAHRRTFIE